MLLNVTSIIVLTHINAAERGLSREAQVPLIVAFLLYAPRIASRFLIGLLVLLDCLT